MADGPDPYDPAVRLYAAGRLPEAERALRAVVSHRPRHADALHLLGVIAYRQGRAQGAIPLVRQAIAARPPFPTAWNTLGECFRAIGRPEDAIHCYRTAVGHDPALAAANANLAIALCEAGRSVEAVAAARAAVAVDPEMLSAQNILSTALLRSGDADAAVATLDAALAVDPSHAASHNNRGAALEALGRLPEALDAYVRAAELEPASAVIANNCTNVARQLNRYDEAMAWTLRSLAADPNHAPARWALGLLQLTAGNYAEGLVNYEWRFAGTGQRHPPDLLAHGRPWDGRQDLTRGTLLLYAEQGFGDGFQAARYVPLLAGRVGRVVVLCHRQQHRLFAGLPGAAAVVASGTALPTFDRFAAMMSLPYLCGTRSLEEVPRTVPYLSPPADAVGRWRERLPTTGRLRVGLVWAGSAKPDPLRTCPWPLWDPVLAVPDVDFYGLQVGPAAATSDGRITDLSTELTDFADTAAAMGQLDLIVTIDTATAHLAGGLGRPTWTLVPFSPDWRWLLDRSDSPWYPTMRLYRQAERGQWAAVIARVAADLRAAAARHLDPV